MLGMHLKYNFGCFVLYILLLMKTVISNTTMYSATEYTTWSEEYTSTTTESTTEDTTTADMTTTEAPTTTADTTSTEAPTTTELILELTTTPTTKATMTTDQILLSSVKQSTSLSSITPTTENSTSETQTKSSTEKATTQICHESDDSNIMVIIYVLAAVGTLSLICNVVLVVVVCRRRGLSDNTKTHSQPSVNQSFTEPSITGSDKEKQQSVAGSQSFGEQPAVYTELSLEEAGKDNKGFYEALKGENDYTNF